MMIAAKCEQYLPDETMRVCLSARVACNITSYLPITLVVHVEHSVRCVGVCVCVRTITFEINDL